jgi:TetR/AcrR family acrAB operon transcriptional repressor
MEPKQRSIRILTTASRLMTHYGFDKTTMEDIAREAGVSKGALYLVWSSKDALFEALLGYEMQRLLDDLQARVEQDPLGGSISNLYRHTLLALRKNPLMCALYARDSRILGDFVRRQDVDRYTRRLIMGEESVANMQAAGLLRRDLHPQVITYLFTIIALGFLSMGSIFPESDAPPLEEVGEALAAMLQGGLEAPGGDNAQGKQTFVQMIDFMRKQYP